MSDWRDELKKAPLSFRGVRILCSEITEEGGFYNDKKIYPSLGGWDIDQISHIPDSFRVSGSLIGDDYLEKMELLREAVKTSGAGALVFPGVGEVQVLVAKWSIRFSNSKKGMVSVSISFDKEQPDEITFTEPDPSQNINDHSEDQKTQTAAYAEENTDMSSDTLLLEAKRAFGAVFQEIMNITAMLQGKTGPLADVIYEIDAAQAKLDTLVTLPGELILSTFNIIDKLISFVETGESFALVDPIRSCLQDFGRALKFRIDPGQTDQDEEIPRTQNTRTAEHSYKVMAFYGSAMLMENFVPWSREDAEAQAKKLVALSLAAEAGSVDENEVLKKIRTQAVALLYRKVRDLGLENQKEIFLATPRNVMSLASELGTTMETLQKFNRPENLFFMSGRIIYV